MKVLITGVAGFVGSRLARALLERGDAVVGLDNFHPYYAREHKTRHLRDLLGWENFAFAEGDIDDENFLENLFARHQFDAVAHLAAMAAVRYSVRYPLDYGRVNVQGTLNVLDAARLNGLPRCVLASTGSVYGNDTPVPFVETAAASSPLAPYPASKRAMELFAHAFSHSYQLPTTILRFFNVYGPHGRPDMMPWQWTMQIARGEPITLFDGGRLKRDWTHIDDIVNGFMGALDTPFQWEIFNLGAGRPVENRAFVQVLESVLNRRAIIEDVPAPNSEPTETFADINKARALLGYEPQTGVEQGLAQFVDWLRDEKLLD